VLDAADCTVRELQEPEGTAFLDQNHLRGGTAFETAYGLEYNGEIISAAMFSRSTKQTAEYELISFCSKLNFKVSGGLQKIVLAFAKDKKPKSLAARADRSYSTGAGYLTAGFKLKRTLLPAYWYFNKDRKRVHPKELTKDKLQQYYNGLDLTKTEWELLRERGWNRIWDCGQLVFIKTFKEHQ
jgi:hypothetical protein